jgi:membrane protease YdiL (CAAX protease family)
VDVLAVDQAGPPLTVVDLFAQELPFLIIAVTGVGIFMRRTAPETALRLGVVRPAWWQVTLALAAGGLFVAFSVGIGQLSQTWTPDIAHRIDVTTQHVFGGLANPGNPIGILALALLPAIGEEILFRGALQPRLGLVVTALLFTSIHTQYSISFGTLTVFILALGLGLIRKYTNTTTSAISHATYNLIASIGIGSQVIGFAIAAEVVLAAVTAYALWSYRARVANTSNP